MADIKILIADDHAVVREGLRSVIESIDGVEVIAEASDGEEAVKICRWQKPDLVIMDISMPKMNGIESTRAIKKEFEEIKILALSMHNKGHFVQNIFEAGASGYLLKDCVVDEIQEAISKIIAGEIFICSRITDVVKNDYVNKLKVNTSGSEELSPREREVVKLLANGLKTKDIASKLFISPRTVEMHRSQVMRKLNIKSVAGVVKYAIREGITDLDLEEQ